MYDATGKAGGGQCPNTVHFFLTVLCYKNDERVCFPTIMVYTRTSAVDVTPS